EFDYLQFDQQTNATVNDDHFLLLNDNDDKLLKPSSFFIDDSWITANDFLPLCPLTTGEQQIPNTTTPTHSETLESQETKQEEYEQEQYLNSLFVNGNEITFINPIVTDTNPLAGEQTANGSFKESSASGITANDLASLFEQFEEPKASVVIIAEDATRCSDLKPTTSLCETDLTHHHRTSCCCQLSSTHRYTSPKQTRRTNPREVILFRNGEFISKEPVNKTSSSTPTTACCHHQSTPPSLQTTTTVSPSAITGTGVNAAAQVVACNVLRQATANDAFIENLNNLKREPEENECCCRGKQSVDVAAAAARAHASCLYDNSSTLKILGCNATVPVSVTPFSSPACSPKMEFLTTDGTKIIAETEDNNDFKGRFDHQFGFCQTAESASTTQVITIKQEIKQEPQIPTTATFIPYAPISKVNLLPKTSLSLQAVPTSAAIFKTVKKSITKPSNSAYNIGGNSRCSVAISARKPSILPVLSSLPIHRNLKSKQEHQPTLNELDLRTIFIGNVPLSMTEHDLRKRFERFDVNIKIELVKKKKVQHGYVTFSDANSASIALQHVNDGYNGNQRFQRMHIGGHTVTNVLFNNSIKRRFTDQSAKREDQDAIENLKSVLSSYDNKTLCFDTLTPPATPIPSQTQYQLFIPKLEQHQQQKSLTATRDITHIIVDPFSVLAATKPRTITVIKNK
ncbi:unnamed protein product, partial [Didymodactylos carnosus]